jgi:hypothetical protein
MNPIGAWTHKGGKELWSGLQQGDICDNGEDGDENAGASEASDGTA